MSSLDARICDLKRLATGKIGSRLKHEIGYARRISLVNDGKYDALLSQALDALEAAARTSGTLTDADALAVEQRLLPMQADCKKYRLLMVGHAHIDMNWMWRYDETVSITLDTFRTVLNLMQEFPEFTFAQSQASTYRIVEEFEPAMLEEIRARIAAGQWEVAASTWVEADRNMPSVESVARHFLYSDAQCRIYHIHQRLQRLVAEQGTGHPPHRPTHPDGAFSLLLFRVHVRCV